uniref:Fibrinogen-related domain containing protein n=1 Tax=Rhipicephalus zambeziensis TaxID=60191 RepID=A0A224Y5Y0_9ACAR
MAVNNSFIFVLATILTRAVLQDTTALPVLQKAEDSTKQFLEVLSRIKRTVKPRHCADLLAAGQRNSGVYTVFHGSAGSSGQDVYCDMETDGGGWTVIQERGQYGNNAYYFYRNWTQYASGFGDPAKEYWIGNEALHALTSTDEMMTLRVFLGNSTEDGVWIDYDSFRISNKNDNYAIKIGKYVGPAGWDALSYANNMMFSTFDRDNDQSTNNCALIYKGAWWFQKCHNSNLNGLNLNGYHDSKGDGIDWSSNVGSQLGTHHSYPWARMMIRPVGYKEHAVRV